MAKYEIVTLPTRSKPDHYIARRGYGDKLTLVAKLVHGAYGDELIAALNSLPEVFPTPAEGNMAERLTRLAKVSKRK